MHLILSKGADSCEVTKHLNKVCVPSSQNEKPVTPEKAMFKELLESKEPKSSSLRNMIDNAVSLMFTLQFVYNLVCLLTNFAFVG